MTNTQTVANQFGGFEPPSPEIQAEIERLSRQPYLELNRVKNCHNWIYGLLLDLLQKSHVKCDRELIKLEKYGLRNSQKPESRRIQTLMWSEPRDFQAHG